jgi:hypothetical protein
MTAKDSREADMSSSMRAYLITLSLMVISLVFLGSYVAIIGITWGPAIVGKTSTPSDENVKDSAGDFIVFYAASSLARAGHAAEAYHYPRLHQEQKKIMSIDRKLPWHYPPTFLLVILPTSLLPFYWSWILWLCITLLLCLAVVFLIAPHPLTPWLTLAFPGIFINFICGQNGFLSAALLGGGLLLLERRPWAGGLLLGLLTYKPHLALLIPLALMAGRRWQALGAMAASAGAFALLSLTVFGLETWTAFFQNTPRLKILLTSPMLWEKMASAFAAISILGGDWTTAWLLQGGVMLGAMIAVVWVWHRDASPARRGAALTLGILLFSPYLFYYDLAILALPLAWLGWEGSQQGWLFYEPFILALGWLSPLVLCLTAASIPFPLAPLVLIALLLATLRRPRLFGR